MFQTGYISYSVYVITGSKQADSDRSESLSKVPYILTWYSAIWCQIFDPRLSWYSYKSICWQFLRQWHKQEINKWICNVYQYQPNILKIKNEPTDMCLYDGSWVHWNSNVSSEHRVDLQYILEIGVIFRTNVIYSDNQGTIKILTSETSSHKTRHVDIRLQFAKQFILTNKYSIRYVTSDENIADIFTKTLQRLNFSKLMSKLMILDKWLVFQIIYRLFENRRVLDVILYDTFIR